MAQRAGVVVGYVPDIFIRGKDDEVIALVEVKNPRLLTHDIARALYRDIVDRMTAHAPYFLLLSQQRGYLWERSGRSGGALMPTVEFPMGPVMTRYAPTLHHGERLRGRELDYVVLQWLVDLATGSSDNRDGVGEPDTVLADAGFLAAIRDASVTFGRGDSAPRDVAAW